MSTSTVSTSIAPTITPARCYLGTLSQTKSSRPLRGPKLSFTSAKTGAGVSEEFAYVARRVVMRWEWEEANASGLIVGSDTKIARAVALGAAGGVNYTHSQYRFSLPWLL
jgi:hypothetical protein